MSYVARFLRRLVAAPGICVLIILIMVLEMPPWIFGIEIKVFSDLLQRLGDWCE